jgi:hypothetical protein
MNDYASAMSIPSGAAVWNSNTGNGWSSTGSITITATDTTTIYPLYDFLTNGAMLKVQYTDYTSGAAVTKTQWVQVTNSTIVQNSDVATAETMPAFISALSQASALTLNQTVQNGAIILQICPLFRSELNTTPTMDLTTTEMAQVQAYFQSNRPFTLWYQFNDNTLLQSGIMTPGTWLVTDYNVANPTAGSSMPAVRVADVQYIGSSFWTLQIDIGTKIVFQSQSNVQFYQDANSEDLVDYQTGLAVRDHITFMKPELAGVSFDIESMMYESDGFYDPTRVVVTPTDTNNDGSPDNPEDYRLVIDDNHANCGYVFFYGDDTTQDSGLLPLSIDGFKAMPANGQFVDGTIFCLIDDTAGTQTFYEYESGVPVLLTDPGYVALKGAGNLAFEWKHYASLDMRIDPAITNVIDAFVLTSDYDYAVRQWIAAGCDPTTEPTPPTDLALANQFSSLNQYKMFSDQMVWRPVQYKYLFGSTAETALQAQFKVVTIPNTTMSQGEIASAIISAINTYFDVNRWEFGETFYFSELSAFIHIQLATAISSIVIVPTSANGVFGNLYEVRSDTNELFISTAQVSDIVFINSNTAAQLRIS